MNTASITVDPIGRVHACYREKFGIPRQPGLVPVTGRIQIYKEYAREEAFRSLEGFSHIWVLFLFHESVNDNWKPTVRPPRLGGNQRVGVFASRSMFRPNPLGLSVVELLEIQRTDAGMELVIRGGDMLDGTPVLDIKPYLPYVDAIPAAQGGYAPQPPPAAFDIVFEDEVLAVIESCRQTLPELKQTIIAILQYDPRPAYHTNDYQQTNSYAMRLFEFDMKWYVQGQSVIVYALDRLMD